MCDLRKGHTLMVSNRQHCVAEIFQLLSATFQYKKIIPELFSGTFSNAGQCHHFKNSMNQYHFAKSIIVCMNTCAMYYNPMELLSCKKKSLKKNHSLDPATTTPTNSPWYCVLLKFSLFKISLTFLHMWRSSVLFKVQNANYLERITTSLRVRAKNV